MRMDHEENAVYDVGIYKRVIYLASAIILVSFFEARSALK